MMVIFMAGIESTPDLDQWITLQWVVAIAAAAITVFCLMRLRGRLSWKAGFTAWWAALPQWMILAFIVLFLMAGVGELSFLLLFNLTGSADPWREHVPLISMTISSIAFMALYCESRAAQGKVANVSGRWQ